MSQTPVLIILAGGASSRMWPLREKSLLRFGDEPLLLSQLRTYESLGFHQAVIVGNPHNVDDIRGLVAGLHDRIQVQVVVQPEPTGMGDAVLRAAAVLPDAGAIYITQVHDVVELRLHADMLKMYRSNPHTTYLAGVEMQDYFPGGYLIIDDTGMIGGIVEKPGADKRPSNYVNIVAHIHADAGQLFAAIRAEYERNLPSDDHYERAMDVLMKQRPYRMVPYAGRWDALKFPWHTLDIMEAFLRRITGQTIAPSAYVAPTASLVGDVFISEGAKIFPGAAVVGPAYIGKNTIVGNNALVRHSMVLDRCNVGFTSEIARSYVADGCQMHACRVLDSVFAPNVNFSAGCTTANLRIDKGPVNSTVKGSRLNTGRDKLGAIIGQDAFLGVDVMTMPGVKIGERAQVGPGTHVHKDIQDGVRVYVKQELLIVTDKDSGD
ncbi:MAG: NTP transferase domain-containing protein [Anaerolineae bacterium]|nr:NTP transferase domain-containing protein [Anaerolineae bacterium]